MPAKSVLSARSQITLDPNAMKKVLFLSLTLGLLGLATGCDDKSTGKTVQATVKPGDNDQVPKAPPIKDPKDIPKGN